MTNEHAALARRYEPADLAPLLDACDVSRTVLVQSAASDEDTDYMFEVAGDFDRVAAIVGWCRLDDAAAAGARLDELQKRPKLRGIRHLIHQERDPHWLLRPAIAESLSLLAERRLLLELPAVYPHHLGDVPELAARHPELTLVIDHLGKPPLGSAEIARWESLLRAAAEPANVCAKISGLNTATPKPNWSADDLQPAVDVAVEAFGPDRLMYGSDWPVALLNGTYERVHRESVLAIRRACGEPQRILEWTAERLYGLSLPPSVEER